MREADFRSDTKTRPNAAMRKAMAEAEVGDDVAGEDPSVNRLEAMAAERLGKEAAVYVTSGTQGNLVALLAHCQRGDEVILGDTSHIVKGEGGGPMVLGGIVITPLPVDNRGMLAPDHQRKGVGQVRLLEDAAQDRRFPTGQVDLGGIRVPLDVGHPFGAADGAG